MKYRLLNFTSIIIGLIFSLIFVKSNASIEVISLGQIFPIITSLILQGITVLTMILLLSSLCISGNRLLRNRQFWKIIRYFFISAIIIYLSTQILAFLVSKIPFLPSDQVPHISRIRSSLSIFGLSVDTWNQISSIEGVFSWILAFSRLNGQHYAIWFVFFCAISFVMLHDIEASEPTYNLLDSISRLSFRLLQSLFALLSIYLIVYTVYTVWQIRSNALLVFYMGFFVRMIIITALLFLIAPLSLLFIYKDKNAYLFLWQSFLSIFTSLLTGNTTLSMATLIVEQKNRFAMPRNITGVLNPLSLLFLRPGSAIALAYSFTTYYSSNTRWQLNFFPEIFWVIIVPIAFAIIIGLFSIPSYFMVLPFYFVLFGLGTTDTFVIMTPVLLLGQSFANCIDVLSWNLLNYIYNKSYGDTCS